MAKSTDLDAAEVTLSQARTAASLLIVLDQLNCLHVLSEKFANLVSHYGLCMDNEDYDGAHSAQEDIEHFICYPNNDD